MRLITDALPLALTISEDEDIVMIRVFFFFFFHTVLLFRFDKAGVEVDIWTEVG
jgi:hypothetical protein